jgi:DNA-binding MarR family transcriptional regulator
VAPEDPSAVFRAFVDAVGLHGQAAATAAGLPATDWYALSVLDLDGDMTAGELASRTGLTTGAATRMIDRLVRAGRVRRVPDPGDRRRVLVERVASPEARSEVDDLVDPARRSVGAVFEEFSTAEQAVLFTFFARAAPAFREATDAIRRESSAGRRRS